MSKVDIADRVRIRAMKACTGGDMELFHLLVEVLNCFESTNRFYGTPLTALGLTVRTHSILERDGVYSVEQLKELSKIDLLKMPGMGKKSLREVEEALILEQLKPSSEQEQPQ